MGRFHWTLAAACVAALLSAAGAVHAQGNGAAMVYVMTNAEDGNEVVAFRAADDGTLTRLDSYPTGGDGTGTRAVSRVTPQDGIDPLASQGSLTFSPDDDLLFAVNAGSGSVSSFEVDDDGTLTLVDVEPSGGAQPNSIAVSNGVLYVSNVGDPSNAFSSNVSGFRIGGDGGLSPIAGSTRKLSTRRAQPSSIAFNPDGDFLAVSELSTGRISVFPVDADGELGTLTFTRGSGPGPFGSIFLSDGTLLVSEAPANAFGALSSYSIEPDGSLEVITGSRRTTQFATCWVVTSRDERFAYTSNTASGTISTYIVRLDGSLVLRRAIATFLEGRNSGPIDMGVSADGRYLYVLDGAIGAISALGIESDGSLRHIQGVPGLPMRGTQGLAIR